MSYGKRICFSMCVTVLMAGLAYGQSNKPPDRAAVERGRHAYIVHDCYSCHGWYQVPHYRFGELERSAMMQADDGSGDVLIPFLRVGTECKIEARVTPMPGYPRASDQDLSDIVAYSHYERNQRLAGKAVLGKAFFEGAGTCATCHKPGDLVGIGPRYDSIAIRELLGMNSGFAPLKKSSGLAAAPGEHRNLMSNVSEQDFHDLLAYLITLR